MGQPVRVKFSWGLEAQESSVQILKTPLPLPETLDVSFGHLWFISPGS